MNKMNKRNFLKNFLSLASLAAMPVAAGKITRHTRQPSPLLIQTSPLAGFQYYEGERLWSKMHLGDRLNLRHTPSNPYDSQAVEVWWHDNLIGHLPRQENLAVSQMLDRGETMYGVLMQKRKTDNPRERIRVEVWRDADDGFVDESSTSYEAEWRGGQVCLNNQSKHKMYMLHMLNE